MADDFKVGDIVRVKSGSCYMVIETTHAQNVNVLWFYDGNIKSAVIPKKLLDILDMEKEMKLAHRLVSEAIAKKMGDAQEGYAN